MATRGRSALDTVDKRDGSDGWPGFEMSARVAPAEDDAPQAGAGRDADGATELPSPFDSPPQAHALPPLGALTGPAHWASAHQLVVSPPLPTRRMAEQEDGEAEGEAEKPARGRDVSNGSMASFASE